MLETWHLVRRYTHIRILFYVYINFIDNLFGLQLPHGSKTAINQKNDNDVSICWHDVMVNFFCCCWLSLVKLSYSSKFYFNIMTGSRVMIIFVYKGGPKIQKLEILVGVSSNIWRLRRVSNTKCGTNVFYKMLLDAPKCQGCSSYYFWVIKGKLTER